MMGRILHQGSLDFFFGSFFLGNANKKEWERVSGSSQPATAARFDDVKVTAETGVLTYLHSDHLGSTSRLSNTMGGLIADTTARYLGQLYQKRLSNGAVIKHYRFNGQMVARRDSSALTFFPVNHGHRVALSHF